MYSPFSQFRKEQSANVLRQKEIPVEHYISLPLPALLHGKPAYVYFACAAQKIAGQEGTPVKVEYGGIDRCWALSAENGALLKYDILEAAPGSTVLNDGAGHTLAELKNMLGQVDQLMDQLAPDYFDQAVSSEEKAIAAPQKNVLLQELKTLIPSPLFPLYQKTSPDFLEWLSR